MLDINSKLLENLYGKDLIAYGTGKAGKIVIPYLAQHPDIRLHGVTNSRITESNAGIFSGTNIPIRSLKAWHDMLPDATVLITAIDPKDVTDMCNACEQRGFDRIILASRDLVNAIAYGHTNLYALPDREFLSHCETWARYEANPLLEMMCFANELHDVHKESFREFKGCHREENVAVIATGSSMNYYSFVEDFYHIGVNAACKRKDIKFDYFFLFHYVEEWCKELKKISCVKFFGHLKDGPYYHEFPESVIEENEGRKFFQANPNKSIHMDIEYYPLMGFRSIVFSAIHFALYTRAKRIFLVGCDASANEHFDGATLVDPDKQIEDVLEETCCSDLQEGYHVLKEFVNRHYPELEIVSVNPVGLKGMFRDVYTESYLDAHPEIDRTKCEILRSEDY